MCAEVWHDSGVNRAVSVDSGQPRRLASTTSKDRKTYISTYPWRFVTQCELSCLRVQRMCVFRGEQRARVDVNVTFAGQCGASSDRPVRGLPKVKGEGSALHVRRKPQQWSLAAAGQSAPDRKRMTKARREMRCDETPRLR